MEFFVEYIANESHSLNTLTITQFYTPKVYLDWINPDFYTLFFLNIPDFMRYKQMF